MKDNIRAHGISFVALLLIAVITLLLTMPTLADQKDEADLMARLRNEHLTMKPVEGGKGDTFGYAYLQAGEHFTNLIMHWKSVIDGISFKTDLGRSTFYSNTNGSGENPKDTNHEPPLPLSANQYISSITIEVADYQPKRKTYRVIKGIVFHIMNKNGNKEPDFPIRGENAPYGGHRATINLQADPGHEICGFWGYYGTVMDSLGIIERPVK